MYDRTLLIISTDPVIAALFGAWGELARLTPRFVNGATSPIDALEATRPAAVLVDLDHRAAMSEAFLNRARLARIPVLLFSPRHEQGDVAREAATRGLAWVPLPGSYRQVVRLLEDVTGPEPAGQR